MRLQRGWGCGKRLTIDTRAGAGITRSGAAIGVGSLSRRIGDIITASIASTLEGVVESEPVSDLMSRGASHVEVSHGTTRKGRIEDDDSVVPGVGRVVARESSVTEETLPITAGETDGVEVERAGISRSESVLHGGLLAGVWSGVVEPPRVRCPADVLQLEAETTPGIILIQDIDLCLDLGISVVDHWSQKNGIRRIDRATYGT